MNQCSGIGDHYRSKFGWQGSQQSLRIRMSIQAAREPQKILNLFRIQSCVDLGNAGEMRIPHTRLTTSFLPRFLIDEPLRIKVASFGRFSKRVDQFDPIRGWLPTSWHPVNMLAQRLFLRNFPFLSAESSPSQSMLYAEQNFHVSGHSVAHAGSMVAAQRSIFEN